MEELEGLAEKVKTELKINYDAEGIKFLEGFIERNKSGIARSDWDGLINSCGAFLGQCIIVNYGGVWKKDNEGYMVVAFDDKNTVYPFSKVRKQFENGLEDSISSMYNNIPLVFKLIPKPPKKKWWQF